MIAELQQMPLEQQAIIAGELLEDLLRRNVHASIIKRLQTSGWNHNLVRGEMIKFYGLRSRGEVVTMFARCSVSNDFSSSRA